MDSQLVCLERDLQAGRLPTSNGLRLVFAAHAGDVAVVFGLGF